MSGDFVPEAASRYWKHSLWLTVGITLLALLGLNVLYATAYAGIITVAVLFSLLSAVAMTGVLRRVAATRQPCIGAFLAYALLRLAAALACIVGYMMVTGLRGSQLLPFVIVLSAYFILLDALDAWYMVRIQKALRNEQ